MMMMVRYGFGPGSGISILVWFLVIRCSDVLVWPIHCRRLAMSAIRLHRVCLRLSGRAGVRLCVICEDQGWQRLSGLGVHRVTEILVF